MTQAEKIKVPIDRGTWRYGGNSSELVKKFGVTQLRNGLGLMCCLGFIGKALGRPIQGIAYPCGSFYEDEEQGHWPELTVDTEYGVWLDTALAADAASVNDTPCSHRSRGEREEEILKLFKDSIYEIEFVGEYRYDQP